MIKTLSNDENSFSFLNFSQYISLDVKNTP